MFTEDYIEVLRIRCFADSELNYIFFPQGNDTESIMNHNQPGRALKFSDFDS